jgi:hypothetical protein
VVVGVINNNIAIILHNHEERGGAFSAGLAVPGRGIVGVIDNL